MMSNFPYMPMFWDAYIQDTDHLSYEQHGLYLNLLRHMWCAPGQRVPNDDVWLARRFRISENDVRDKLRPLVKEFCRATKNFITQDRLVREFQRSKERSEKQSKRSKSRWVNGKGQSHGNAELDKQENCAPAMPTTTTTTTTTTDSSVSNDTAASAARASPGQETEPDLKKLVYDRGKAIMGASAGGLIAKALAKLKLGTVAEIIETMESVRPVDPKAWFQRAVDARLQSRKGPTDGYASAVQY